MTTGKRNPKLSFAATTSLVSIGKPLFVVHFFQMRNHLKKNARTAEKKGVWKKMVVTLKDSGIPPANDDLIAAICTIDDVELRTMMINVVNSGNFWLVFGKVMKDRGAVEVLERATKNLSILTDLINDFSSRKINGAKFKEILHPCTAILTCGIP